MTVALMRGDSVPIELEDVYEFWSLIDSGMLAPLTEAEFDEKSAAWVSDLTRVTGLINEVRIARSR